MENYIKPVIMFCLWVLSWCGLLAVAGFASKAAVKLFSLGWNIL